MKIFAQKGELLKVKSDLLVLFFFEGDKLSPTAKIIDTKLAGALTEAWHEGFKGKEGSFLVINTLKKLPQKKIALVGVGKKSEFSNDKLRFAGATLVKAGRQASAGKIACVLPLLPKVKEKILPEDAARFLTAGLVLGAYNYAGYKTAPKEDKKEIKEIILVASSAAEAGNFKKGIFAGQTIGGAVNVARDLINEPANRKTPTDFVNFSRKLFRGTKVKVTILEKTALQKLGMGAFLAVAAGSAQPPKMLLLSYPGAGPKGKLVGFVGKGITFDSGGISLKPSRNMAEMKDDLSGAAAVCLATKAIADLKIKVNLLSVVPLTENMPGGAASKPSDVVKAFNKKTIEIISTDAEGRLILADALSYAVKKGARYLVDIATLTGGCTVALGDLYSGAVSNNQKFLDQVLAAATAGGEKIWALPNDPGYKEYLKSDVADMKNCPEDGKASPVVGGIFLKEFVGNVPWVHLDIAGTSFLSREIGYLQKNAAGVGVRTLVYLVLNNSF